MKSVHIRNFSGPFSLVFDMYTRFTGVNLGFRCGCGKILTRKDFEYENFLRMIYLAVYVIDLLIRPRLSLIIW